MLRSVDVLGGGADDPAVFAFACQNDRTVMTFNSADFVRLGVGAIIHPGVLLIYQDNRPSDMTVELGSCVQPEMVPRIDIRQLAFDIVG